MTTTVSVPGPTQEERQLQSEQAELLRFQRELLMSQQQQQEALLPYFAQQLGLDLEYNDEGQVIGATQNEDARLQSQVEREFFQQQLDYIKQQREDYGDSEELRQKQKEIELKLADRSLAALSGDLPVDPALEKELSRQEETLRSRLSAQLGPGYESSSAGIEALRAFSESAAALRSGAQTGQLTLAEQLGLARSQAELSRNQFRQSQLSVPLSLSELGLAKQSAFSQQAFGVPGQQVQQFGQIAAGFGAAQQPYQQQRQLQTQVAIANAGIQGDLLSGIGKTVGTVFGATPLFSSATVKVLPMVESNARLGGTLESMELLVEGLPIYVFKYLDGTERIGTIAEEVAKVMPEAVTEVRGILAVDYGAIEIGHA